MDWLDKIHRDEIDAKERERAQLQRQRVADQNAVSAIPHLFAVIKTNCYRAVNLPPLVGKLITAPLDANGWQFYSKGVPLGHLRFWQQTDHIRYTMTTQTTATSAPVVVEGLVAVKADLDGRVWFEDAQRVINTAEDVSEALLKPVVEIARA